MDKRKKQIEKVQEDTKFKEPVTIDREITAEGQLASYDKFGRTRDSGLEAFPINIQPNERRRSITDSFWNGETNYVDLPGRVLNYPVTPTGNNTLTFNLNIDALDARSIMDRSTDITRAIYKELKQGQGGDLAIAMQSAIFGV
jgi:hypothetical protein